MSRDDGVFGDDLNRFKFNADEAAASASPHFWSIPIFRISDLAQVDRQADRPSSLPLFAIACPRGRTLQLQMKQRKRSILVRWP